MRMRSYPAATSMAWKMKLSATPAQISRDPPPCLSVPDPFPEPPAFPDQRGEPVQRTRPASNYGNRSVEPEVSVRNGALNTLKLLREFGDLYPQPGDLRVGRLFAHRRDTHTNRGVTQPGGDAPRPGAESK